MHLHPFDDAIALQRRDDGLYEGRTHPAWANMVGPYGGITAAVLLNAAWIDTRRLGEPLSLTVNFAAPLADGEFTIEARAARTNRTTQHWTMALRQAGEVACTASAVFAIRRPTWSAAELHPPDVPAAEAVPPVASPAPVAWPARYEMRFVRGGWIGRDSAGEPCDDSESLLWLRDDPPRPLDALALAALADVFYPRIFRRRQRFTPAGTVSMTTCFHADAAALAAQGARPVLARAQGQRFVGGFFDQAAALWGDDGQLLASSQQVVYYRE
jgi:acyl-CoA thioesterase